MVEDEGMSMLQDYVVSDLPDLTGVPFAELLAADSPMASELVVRLLGQPEQDHQEQRRV